MLKKVLLYSVCFMFFWVTSGQCEPMKIGEKMKDYASVFPLDGDKNPAEFKVVLTGVNAPGCVFTSDEQPQLEFQIQNLTDAPISCTATLHIVSYGTRGVPGGIWLPQVFKIADVGNVKIPVDVPAGKWQNHTVDLKLPDAKGGYGVIIDLGKYGKRKLATMIRTFKHKKELIQYPKQSLEKLDPVILSRLGVHAIRYALDYHHSEFPGYADYIKKLEKEFQRLYENGVTVTVEIGSGKHHFPLGRPRPHLNDKAQMQPGKMDYVWPPSDDDDFQKFCQSIASRFGWPKGPVTGFMLWNEPWEGASISGWQADMPRYRELYRRMAVAVKQACTVSDVDVLVGGCDSSSNTWDKLFPDGSDEFLPYLDFCSIHYQGLSSPALFKKWAERNSPHGRVRIWDTESWVANMEDRFAAVVATNRAAGYDRSMGIFGGNVSTWGHHKGQPTAKVYSANGNLVEQAVPVQTWPPAAAVSAVQHFIGQREFDRLLFQKGLPWVYVFKGLDDQPDDGTVVVVGDIGSLFGSNQPLYRTVRSLDEASKIIDGTKNGVEPEPFSGATMRVQADKDYALYDFYGNVIPPDQNGQLVIPLDSSGYCMRANPEVRGSFEKLLSAIRSARIEGIEPLEIIPQDITKPLGNGANLKVCLSNVLNRPVSGSLKVELAGKVIGNDPLSLKPHETRTVNLDISRIESNPGNIYPFFAVFSGPDGIAVHKESLHVNIIAYRKIKVDGKLDDWTAVLPQTVSSDQAQVPTLTEASWLPFKKFDPGKDAGIATGYLAYDEDFFYFAIKVADDTKDPGMLRYETRSQDEDFYPEVSYETDADGNTISHTWPKDVRRFSYRRSPSLPSGDAPSHDNVLIAFNAIPFEKETEWLKKLPGCPPRFTAYKCTDYEFALNPVSQKFGGGFEVWKLLVPGMPRKHFYPRQPAHPLEGAVSEARLVVKYDGNTRITELALPWSALPEVKALKDAGKTVRFSYKAHDNNGGPDLELAMNRGVSRVNTYAFHCDWKRCWANEVCFSFESHDR